MKITTINIGTASSNIPELDEKLVFTCKGQKVFITYIENMPSDIKPIEEIGDEGIYRIEDFKHISCLGSQHEFTDDMFVDVGIMTAREKALAYVHSYDQEYLSDLIVRGHSTHSHEWLAVEPDGVVHEIEDSDNSTRHYVNYPDKPVKNIYDIHSQSAESCNCDVCSMYRRYEDVVDGAMDEEDFIKTYGAGAYERCENNSLESAILDKSHDEGVYESDVHDKIIEAINNIPYGYFEDEEEPEENS